MNPTNNLTNPGESPSGFVADATVAVTAVTGVVSWAIDAPIPAPIVVLIGVAIKLIDKYFVKPRSLAAFNDLFDV